MSSDFRADVESVQRIDAVPRILDVICRTTGTLTGIVPTASPGRAR
jgi:hypothetical protein